MFTRSGRIRLSAVESSPPKTRKGSSPSRSPGRPRKTSPPTRSPSRKSPVRRSPSRKSVSKLPARKSPSRTNKETIEVAARKSPAKGLLKDVQVILQDTSDKVELNHSTRARRSEYSIKDCVQENIETVDKINGVESGIPKYELKYRKPIEEVGPRRSSRLREHSAVQEIRSSVDKDQRKSGHDSVDVSDDEEVFNKNSKHEKSLSVTRRLITPARESIARSILFSPWEFGGRVGSLFNVILLPLTVVVILISCTGTCTFHSFTDLSKFKILSVWFSPLAFIMLFALYLIQAAFTLLPYFGSKSCFLSEIGKKYCFNGFFSCIFSVVLLIVLEYKGIFSFKTILKEYFHLAVGSYTIGVVISVINHLYSSKVIRSANPNGNTGFYIYDYWMGRDIHPQIKGLNLKIWTCRISNISAIILALCVLQQGIVLNKGEINSLSLDNYHLLLDNVKLKSNILIYSLMQIIYILYFLVKEKHLVSSFLWQYEGVGYMLLVSRALYPYYFITISKFVAESNFLPSNYILIGTLILFIVGFFIMMVSNEVKYEFRRDPLNRNLAYLETMPTFHGKKLIVSGMWGVVRHPNYIGDMLIQFSLALPGIVSQNFIAASPALLTILMLLHRSWRDHVCCKSRYGAAWQRYCKKVPNLFIPKVF